MIQNILYLGNDFNFILYAYYLNLVSKAHTFLDLVPITNISKCLHAVLDSRNIATCS